MSFPLKTLSALALCGFALNAYSFNPGTCTIVKPGIGGDVPVTVTFSNDRIEAITIGENNETPGIGKVAIEQLPATIIEEQSVGVDGLSGASITSGAILAAVSECIVQAGGDLEKMKVVKAKGPAQAKDLETDVIIVGAGAAGQAATIRASELGKNVILLEKQPFAGGAAAVNGGTVVTQGSNLQKEMGSLNDSNELMTQDYLDNGHNLNDRRMLKLYVENIGPTVDWAISNAGMHVNKEAGFTNEAEHSVPRVVRWIDGSQGATRDLKAAVA
ncbi:MAG: FAD-dependent oxidoreductase, partial [Burkholderiales bacterium]|nr:FAD-dependent oxidoreductase [Burkholderiales bacterium]